MLYRAKLFALCLTLWCCAGVPTPTAPSTEPPPTGQIYTSDGQPLPGTLVTATNPRSGTSVTVRTHADGRYRLPPPIDASYTVQAHLLGYEASEAVTIASSDIDFVLAPAVDVRPDAPSAMYLNRLPDGLEKRDFILDCTGCHQFNRVRGTAGPLQRPRAAWAQWTSMMLSFAGAHTGFPIMAPSRDADETAAWLTRHLGTPGTPLAPFEAPAPTAPDEHVVITEYPIPNVRDLPHDLMPASDGRIVITGMMTAQMYTLDPQTGAFETIADPAFPGARALTIDGDGLWWVLLGTPRQLMRYDPASGDAETFDLRMYPHSIVQSDDGRIWFNGHFTKDPELMGALDPASGTIETFEVPSPPTFDNGSTIPYGLRQGPNGFIWGTQLAGNRLIRFDPATERFDLYELPTEQSGPRRLDIAADGTVWIPQYAASKLARFDPATETFTEYDLPIRDALPYIVRADPATGVVWIATGAADAVLRFFPEDERFTVHPLPTRSALVRHMELDPNRNAVWVAYGNSPAVAPKVARIDVLE